MRLFLLIVLGIIFITGCQKPTAQQSDFFVMQATDLHVLSPQQFDDGELLTEIERTGDGKQIRQSADLFTKLLEEVKDKQPDGLILTGDLSFHGDLTSHELIAQGLKQLQADGVPVYVIPGNHDWGTRPYGYFGNDGVEATPTTPEDFARLYSDFGWNQAFSHDEASFSYAVEINPTTWLVMIDVNQIGLMSLLQSGTVDWIDQVMRTAKSHGIKVITASHQNLFQHHALFARGFMMTNVDKLQAIFESYPPIIHLSGHMHVQHQVTKGEVTEVATSSLAIWPHHVAEIRPNGYQAKSLANLTPDWLNQSQAFFRQVSIDKAKERFAENLPPNAEVLANFVADINQVYFSGDLTNIPELRDKPVAKEWLSLTGEARFADYIKAILEEPAMDHRIKDFHEINHP